MKRLWSAALVLTILVGCGQHDQERRSVAVQSQHVVPVDVIGPYFVYRLSNTTMEWVGTCRERGTIVDRYPDLDPVYRCVDTLNREIEINASADLFVTDVPRSMRGGGRIGVDTDLNQKVDAADAVLRAGGCVDVNLDEASCREGR